jgi:hypothetical protein
VALGKRTWNILGKAIILIVAASVAACLFAPSVSQAVHPIPALASDLPATYKEGDRVFNERVQQRFPTGSSVMAMVDALQSQGFEVHSDTPNGKDWAQYEAHDWICVTRWYISWLGANDNLAGVEAHYGASCL